VGGEMRSPPLVGRGLVVVRSTDYRITALDASTGRRRWAYQRANVPLTLRSLTEMVYAGDLVIAGFPSGRLVALTAANGAVRWDVAVSEPRGATEVERLADVVYVGRPTHGQPHSTIELFKLVKDGKEAVRVQVKLGRSSVSTVEILSGLVPGDQVILSDVPAADGQDRLRLD